ncbi:UbiD family decarboxylase [Candidatus Bathyarchaeota archaeon]|nr:UbiD family decarboxylase [Candidatus Bathyarchaeota archaeon]
MKEGASDLRELIESFAGRGEVMLVDKRVSLKFEVAAIIKKYDRKQVLLFNNADGHRNIIAGICGTRDRIAYALGITPERLRPLLTEALKLPEYPKIVGGYEAEKELPSLENLPILTHFEKDAGPYITSAIVSARLPDDSLENVSIHRLMVIDRRHLAIRIVPRHLYYICKKMIEMGKKSLDVGIAIGLHPAILIASSTPAPLGVSEYAVANKILGKKLRLSECRSVEARVPADSEIVLEGRVLLDKEVDEGPFVDITGTYDIVRKQPVIEIEKIFCREDFFYHALLPSGSEHGLLMGLPQEAKIEEAVSGVVPKVKDINLTPGGCHWLHAVISIEKQAEGDGKNAILAAFAGHPSLKHVVIVDTDIDVNNPTEVEWAIATRFQGSKGLVVIRNVRGSSLDASGDQKLNLTTKVGIDATRTLLKPKEKFEKAKIPIEPEV